jgi:hypothetical protein
MVVSAALQGNRSWTLSRGRDGYTVYLFIVPAWAATAEAILDTFPCFHPRRDWSWKVGFGRDEDDEVRFSLGRGLMLLCSARHGLVHRYQRDLHSIPVTRDEARVLSPEWVDEVEEIMADDE